MTCQCRQAFIHAAQSSGGSWASLFWSAFLGCALPSVSHSPFLDPMCLHLGSGCSMGWMPLYRDMQAPSRMQLTQSIALPLQAVLSMCEGNLVAPRLLGDAVAMAAALVQSPWLCGGMGSPLQLACCFALLFYQVILWRMHRSACMHVRLVYGSIAS